MVQGVARFYLHRRGERTYAALGTVIRETQTQLTFRTLKNDIILVQTTTAEGELKKFDDQGIPVEVDVYLNGELVQENSYYFPLAPGLYFVIDQ